MEGGESSKQNAILDRTVTAAQQESQRLRDVRARARFQRICAAVGLTRAEARVANHCAWGLVTDDIARVLFNSPNTIKTHHSHITGKLGETPRRLFSRLMREAIEADSLLNHPQG